MKVETFVEEKRFTPTTIKITCETQAEMDVFKGLLIGWGIGVNYSPSTNRDEIQPMAKEIYRQLP